ncbi:MAG: hypothetical protein H3C38_10700 [Rhodospirillales bacterium]|nr:hypothetical protein [Rhodospirillales bacterium]
MPEEEWRLLGRKAIAALDEIIRERPRTVDQSMVDAVRAIADVRNELVRRLRETGEEEARLRLDVANSALSMAMSVEYPRARFQLQHLEEARKALRALL